MKKLEIVEMTLENYMDKYGLMYEDGFLWDYPISELEYIMQETEIEKMALINNRLYEMV